MTYHNRYGSWEFFRGQEGDLWKGEVKDPDIPELIHERGLHNRGWRHDWVNRKYMQREEDQPQSGTFRAGLEFMRMNQDEDKWFLHIETFDPHEPYFTQQKYKDLYPHDYDGLGWDWPKYVPVTDETPQQIQHLRYECGALHSMCDENLGTVLDLMDELDMWKDTMLIVNTDHGFLMGEHDWFGKMCVPYYNEIGGEGEPVEIELARPFSFTKGVKVMKIKSDTWADLHSFGDLLFDLEDDPEQKMPIEDKAVEERMTGLMVRLMKDNDAPPEQLDRLGLQEFK